MREAKVFPFTEDFVVVPGPRFIAILEKMAAAIYLGGPGRMTTSDALLVLHDVSLSTWGSNRC